jgi:TonB family protein
MKSCPRCGKQYPDTEGFCETDGTALIQTAVLPRARQIAVMSDETEQSLECPVCGGKALPGEVRCNYCGARLQTEDAESGGPTSFAGDDSQTATESGPGPQEFGTASDFAPESETPPKRRRIIAVLGFSAAAVGALAAGAWLAFYLANKHAALPGVSASPSITATSRPVVELARQTPIRVQADAAGTLPRESGSVLKVFEDNKAGLGNVYANALSADPSMSDGMEVRLHILPDGQVDNGAVRLSTLGNPSFDAEVVQAMTSWKFQPVTGSGVTADYRVIFAPSAGAANATESDLNTKLASLSPDEAPEYAFSPSGAKPAAVAERSLSELPGPASPAGSAAPGAPVAVGTPAASSEPTTVAALPPAAPFAVPEVTPREVTPPRPRHHRRRREPPVLASVPPPKPPLLERVNDQLRADRKLRRVHAYTNGSVVTIFGKVFDDKDRLLAERTVRRTDGVSAVVNNLTTDTQQWEQNQNSIAQALQNAGLNNVQVKVIGRDAYLSGQVKTALDRERAVTVAQAAAPVRVRENLITVAIGNMWGF